MSTVDDVSASLNPDQLINLVKIDASAFGGGVRTFTNFGEDVVFNGVTYIFEPFKLSGFAIHGDGKTATPTIQIVPNAWIRSFSAQFDQGRGAILTRTRTYARFLDTGIDPDPTQVFPLEVYFIERLSHGSDDYFEWELSAVTDLEGLKFPLRTIESDTCDFTYRTWNGTAFVPGTCPYAGLSYFDKNGVSTSDPSLDFCPKILDACKLRFTLLPFRGFPGVGAII